MADKPDGTHVLSEVCHERMKRVEGDQGGLHIRLDKIEISVNETRSELGDKIDSLCNYVKKANSEQAFERGLQVGRIKAIETTLKNTNGYTRRQVAGILGGSAIGGGGALYVIIRLIETIFK